MKNLILNRKFILTIVYSLVYAIGLQFFIVPSNFITTGLAGIVQIFQYLFAEIGITVGYGLMYFLFNVPGLFLAYYKIGKKFTFYTLVSVLTVSLITAFIPIHMFSEDLILNCIFGGVIMGFGIGGLLKIGSSSGGTDVYGIWYYQRTGLDFKQFNYVINFVIIGVGGFLFGIEIGLYTLLSLYFRNLGIGNIFTNNDKITVWVIGKDLSKVSLYINTKLKHGTTLFPHAEGGFSHEHKDVLMTVLNKYEYGELINNVYDISPDVFINVTETHKIDGNYKILKGNK